MLVQYHQKLNVLNTKTSDGNENRWRKRTTPDKRKKLCDEFLAPNEFILHSTQQKLLLRNFSLFTPLPFCHFYWRFRFAHTPYTVPFPRSCFEFLGFAAHITFISVQKPHHNCYLLFFIPKASRSFFSPLILSVKQLIVIVCLALWNAFLNATFAILWHKGRKLTSTFTFRSRQNHCLILSPFVVPEYLSSLSLSWAKLYYIVWCRNEIHWQNPKPPSNDPKKCLSIYRKHRIL